MLTKLTSANLPSQKRQVLELWYGSLKIKDFTDVETKELYTWLLNLSKLIGVTEAPDSEIIIMLIKHLQEHHKDFSLQEMEKAFGLATAEKLDMEFKHYNRITPQLVSTVLNQYKKYRSKEIIAYEYELKREKERQEAQNNIPTPQEVIAERTKSCLQDFKKYKEQLKLAAPKRKEITDWGSLNYEFLVDIGLINLSTPEKNKIYEIARKQLILETKNNLPLGKISKGLKELMTEIESGESNELIKKSKQIALNQFFDNLVNQKADFKTEIENALKRKGNK